MTGLQGGNLGIRHLAIQQVIMCHPHDESVPAGAYYSGVQSKASGESCQPENLPVKHTMAS